MGRLEGKVAIVTGGAQGMGYTHVRRFIAEGAKVALTDISEAGQRAADEIGRGALFIQHDVTKADSWEAAVKRVEKELGDIHILVNNAGIGYQVPFDEMTEAEYRKFFDINQLGVFLGIKAVVPSMRRAGGGSIINISSTCGFLALPGTLGYVSTKFAVRGLTKAAAIDLGKDRIRVNSVHPGLTRTPMLERHPHIEKEMTARQPLARASEPDEVTNLVLYLASDEASYSTGSEFIVDGGVTSAH